MRSGLVLLVACATDAVVMPPSPELDRIWSEAIRPGDLVVMVPGTKSYDLLVTPIQAMGGDNPRVDVRQNATVADDAIVFEQAIAAAHRAGVDPTELTYGLWGAGFDKLTAFDYVSYEGYTIHVAILGGTNTCAKGSILDNLFNYTTDDADKDATDLYAKTQAYLAAHPSPAGPRNVIVASHSWGGAVAEYLDFGLAGYEAKLGPLTDGSGVAPMRFTIAAGVPKFILNMPMAGPGTKRGAETFLYEIDRPDDPVHELNPSGNGDGHQYDILYGTDFQGSYGVTTEELSCRATPGPCGPPPHP
jgi:hypothetical protein